jgi:hypothetical protein
MKEGIDRQGMHTFWRNYVSKLTIERKGEYPYFRRLWYIIATTPTLNDITIFHYLA